MFVATIKLRRNTLAFALMIVCGGAAAATPGFSNGSTLDAARMNVSAIDAGQHYTRFIVSYEAGSLELASSSSRDMDLQRVTAETGLAVRHVRTLATGDQLVEVQGDAMRFSRNDDTQRRVMQAFAKNMSVAYVEPDRRMDIAITPNDTHWGVQWPLQSGAGGLNMAAAWDLATGNGVRVAVLDTGITAHSDLAGQTLGGYDFVSSSANARDGNGRDSNPADEGDWYNAGECGGSNPGGSSWHGTHVSGTIAAATNNSKGVAGMAYNARVVPVRVLAKCGGTSSDIVDAMVWASGGSVSGVPSNPYPAKVLNMSLGGGGACGSAYQNAVNAARANGAVVVVAAGNSNVNVSGATPANCSGVIAVASTTSTGARSSFSNYGTGISVSAPGGGGGNDVASTVNLGTQSPTSEGYAYMAGTSMAAPHVAALAALMFELKPSLTPDQVRSHMMTNARALPGACSGGCGAGIIDPLKTLQALGGSGDPPPTGEIALQNGVPVTGIAATSGNWSAIYKLTIPAGASNMKIAMSGGSGDGDLYVNFGSVPTTSSYNCRPYLAGNNETCTTASPQAGVHYVRVRAYSSMSGVSLVASYSVAGGGSNDTLTRGVPVTGLSASSGNWTQTYTITVPAGAKNLVIDTSGGSGDADLYVQLGAEPTTSSYLCRPYRAGNVESCSFANPQAGVYRVKVRAYQTFSGVTLKANYTP